MQNLLHLCAINGSRNSLLYLFNFALLSPNEKDNFGHTPLYYLIKNFPEDKRSNKEMFLWLANVTDCQAYDDNTKIIDLFNEWQCDIFKNYVKKSSLFKSKQITLSDN
jgi:hypothetical protein